MSKRKLEEVVESINKRLHTEDFFTLIDHTPGWAGMEITTTTDFAVLTELLRADRIFFTRPNWLRSFHGRNGPTLHHINDSALPLFVKTTLYKGLETGLTLDHLSVADVQKALDAGIIEKHNGRYIYSLMHMVALAVTKNGGTAIQIQIRSRFAMKYVQAALDEFIDRKEIFMFGNTYRLTGYYTLREYRFIERIQKALSEEAITLLFRFFFENDEGDVEIDVNRYEFLRFVHICYGDIKFIATDAEEEVLAHLPCEREELETMLDEDVLKNSLRALISADIVCAVEDKEGDIMYHAYAELESQAEVEAAKTVVHSLPRDTDKLYAMFNKDINVMGVIGFFGATISNIQKQFPHHSKAQVAVQVNALIDAGVAFTIGSVHFLFSFYTKRQVKFIKRILAAELSPDDILELFEVFISCDSRVISAVDQECYEDMGIIHNCHGQVSLLTSDDEAEILELLPCDTDELEDEFLDHDSLATTLAEMVTAGLICYMPHEGECVYHAYSELTDAQEVMTAKRIWADKTLTPDVRGTVLHAMFYDDEYTYNEEEICDYIKREKGGRTLRAIQQQFEPIHEKVLFEELERLNKAGQIYHRDNHFKTTPFVPCKYGAGCYRIHNADHMAEYIHPEVPYVVGEIISVELASKHKGYANLALITKVHPASKTVDLQWFYHRVDLPRVVQKKLDTMPDMPTPDAMDDELYFSDHQQLGFPIEFILKKHDQEVIWQDEVAGVYCVDKEIVDYNVVVPVY